MRATQILKGMRPGVQPFIIDGDSRFGDFIMQALRGAEPPGIFTPAAVVVTDLDAQTPRPIVPERGMSLPTWALLGFSTG